MRKRIREPVIQKGQGQINVNRKNEQSDQQFVEERERVENKRREGKTEAKRRERYIEKERKDKRKEGKSEMGRHTG